MSDPVQDKRVTTKSGPRSKPLDIDRMLADSEEARSAYDVHGDVLDVAELIRDMRNACGLTQAQLAELAGTTQPHISDLERGIGPQGPTVELLSRIGRACGNPVMFVKHADFEEMRSALESAQSDLAKTEAAHRAVQMELNAAREKLMELLSYQALGVPADVG